MKYQAIKKSYVSRFTVAELKKHRVRGHRRVGCRDWKAAD